MAEKISGIHHITAIANDPQENIDFYTQILGLRLVKLTVNFDNPGAYHFYYGDKEGSPGTILTFFSWPGARRGRHGSGQISTTAFTIPENAVGFWSDRLRGLNVTVGHTTRRFDEEVLPFEDHDGLKLELITRREVDDLPVWENGPIEADYAIRGFHTATLKESNPEPVGDLLANTFGYVLLGEEDGYRRYQAEGQGTGIRIDVLAAPEEAHGQDGTGAVHHIAFRADDDDDQLAWQRKIQALGLNVTDVKDRQYFHSIYFREPGGILFEIATDPPGFTIDESTEALGSGLRLPPWLESERAAIVKALPEVRLPANRVGDNR